MPHPPGPHDDSIARNQDYWTAQATSYAVDAREQWASEEVSWGCFGIPESEVGVLPALAGRDVVELGCGTGYLSAWLLRGGARRVVALDPTPAQLATARRMQGEVGPAFPLLQAAGEAVPLRDATFDLAVSEYGAAIWADPFRWIPEAARLLRPSGELVFLANSVLQVLCAPPEDAPSGTTLHRPQRGLHRVEYPGDPGVEFHLGHGDLLRLLRRCGFEVLDLVELFAPEGAPDQPHVEATWAAQWPAEEIWRARKR